MVPNKRDDQGKTPAISTVNSLSAAVDTRPASPQDFDFAFSVYRKTMKEYSAAYIHWDDEQQKANLGRQLETADVRVITVSRADVGWLALQETENKLTLGHFYIEPQFQNRGVGSTILSRILATSDAKGKSVELSVLKNNPARRFYERSGFMVVSEDEMKYFMRHPNGV